MCFFLTVAIIIKVVYDVKQTALCVLNLLKTMTHQFKLEIIEKSLKKEFENRKRKEK